MKLLTLVAFSISITLAYGQGALDLEKVKWNHGSENCSQNHDPGIQILRYDQDTWILRQNKCIHYEAPFIYLFLGDEHALLVDTGAKAPEQSFPLHDSVMRILSERKDKYGKPLHLIVIHSHRHSDHTAADYQFRNKGNIQLIGPTRDSIAFFFKIQTWPEQEVAFDLGDRQLTIIPIPGHDPTSIAIYDHKTRWLLTGDSVYPGRLYVRDWPAYQASIARLLKFSEKNTVSYLMGNHIEMTSKKGIDYPTGTTWQPDEHILPLKSWLLKELSKACFDMGKIPRREVHDDFIIEPVD